MATIPDPVHDRSTAHSIIKWYARTQNEDPRPHLGCSEIGKECNRALWFGFRWATRKKFEGRILRLFKRGHREEPLFLDELRAIGAEVYDRDPDTKQQYRFYGYRGHFGGSCDAIGRKFPEGPKSWAIVEFKTHGEKSFTELVKNGVQNAKFEHFVQMQMYMGFSELDRALYLAVNKNTDELHSEWIHFDKEIFERMNERAQMIIEAEEPPSGISNDPAFYKCKFCDHQKVCHDDIAPAKSCRTCVHVTLADEGKWKCEHYDRFVSTEEQIVGCRDHLYLPPLIKYAEPLDAGKDWIKYRHKETGLIFANITHGADRSEENMSNDIIACFDSDELAVAHSKIVGDNRVAEVLNQYEGARIVASELNDDDIPF
jgi:hypothetical protein